MDDKLLILPNAGLYSSCFESQRWWRGSWVSSTFHSYLGKPAKWPAGRIKIIVYWMLFLEKKVICSFAWWAFSFSSRPISSWHLLVLAAAFFVVVGVFCLFVCFLFFFFTLTTSWARRGDFILKNNDHINQVTADKLKVTPFSPGKKCSLPPNRIPLLFVCSPLMGGWQGWLLMDSEEITGR